MENYLNISVVSKSSNLSDKNLLSQFVSLYSRLYDCRVQIDDSNEKSNLSLIFANPENIFNRFLKIIELYDSYLTNTGGIHSNLSNNLQAASHCEKGSDFIFSGSSLKFAIFKYQTDLKSVFKDYYHYLNHFFPVINIGCYIEEIDDRFLLFFEKEVDLEFFLFDFQSMASLSKLMKEKHFSLPIETQQKIYAFINKN